MTGLVERLVPDELWMLFRRVVVPPTEVICPQGGPGVARDREGIIFMAASGCAWRQLPPMFGQSWHTVYLRFAQWSRVRTRLHRVILDELSAGGELDWARCAIDSVSMRAAKGTLTGPNPTACGKLGSKIHLLADRNGLPLPSGIFGANMHDSQSLAPLVRVIPLIRSRRGPRRQRPAELHADTGYDYDHLRPWLREHGIRHRIARKGIESSQQPGCHRWVVERTVSWLVGCRRLHRRSERKAEPFLTFAGITAALICHYGHCTIGVGPVRRSRE
ncbi:IS5 family transposase (plasmid) [Streptomyces sp. NBC_01707]